MNAARYFPSIHDGPLKDSHIWAPADPMTHTSKKSNSFTIRSAGKSTLEDCNGCTDGRKSPHQKETVGAPAAWPDTGRLAAPDYRPLEAFSRPAGDASSACWSEADVICELSTRMKEIELCTMIGEQFDIPRYQFLRNIKYYKVKQMKRKIK